MRSPEAGVDHWPGGCGVQVAKAMLDLTRPAELSNLGQGAAPPAVPLEAIADRVNHNARDAAKAAAADADGDVKMEDGEDGGDAKVAETTAADVEAIVSALADSSIVRPDDERPGFFSVDGETSAFMVCAAPAALSCETVCSAVDGVITLCRGRGRSVEQPVIISSVL